MLMLDHTPAARRIRREAHSAARRERALALRDAGFTFASIGQALGVSLERARRITRKAERLSRNPHWTDVLPARAQSFLHIRGLSALPETEAAQVVARLSQREFMDSPNFGRGAFAAIEAWLQRHGHGRPREGAPG
jgi:hypothetical protein